jgi:formyltetrahydrofolate deformylase
VLSFAAVSVPVPAAREYVLTVSCPDAVGLVAAVSSLIASWGGWLTEVANHSDRASGRFFMRNVVAADSLPFGVAEFVEGFRPLALRYRMEFTVRDTGVPKRMLVLVSREGHCLADLLYRWRTRELRCDLRGVVSNHEDLRETVERDGVAFHHVPVPPDGREEAFATIERTFAAERADLVVLARFMQVLPAALCARWAGRVVNIHHGFLPSFAGSRPYQQAFDRGVKLIGATSHFVTADLDQGPIIEQDVIRVDHTDSVEDMIRLGRDVEKTVLARAVRYVLEDRVLLDGAKTVVFR